MLNEGLVCTAVVEVPLRAGSDGRGAAIYWRCGKCTKAARFPLETMFAYAEKQCDWCLATNLIDVDDTPAKTTLKPVGDVIPAHEMAFAVKAE